MFLATFGKTGLKALINTLAGSSLFQEFVHGLIMKRLSGLQVKYPALYTTLDGYALAVSKIPQVTTDDNPNNVDQIAELFALLGQVERSVKALTTKGKELKLDL